MAACTRCQFCDGNYCNLSELVSHTRAAHSHSSEVMVCRINGCPMEYKKVHTWYMHVLASHYEEYENKVPMDSDEGPDQEHEIHVDVDFDVDLDTQFVASPFDIATPTGVTLMPEETIAGKLIKIKEKHNVPNTVMDEIVELVEDVRQDMATNASLKIISHAKECGMNTSLPLFDHLPNIFDRLESPLASVKNTYRQQTFISKNLQHVVSQSSYKPIY